MPISVKKTSIAVVMLAAAFALAACSAPAASPTPSATATGCTPKHTFATVTPGTLTVAGINAPPKFYAASADGPFTGIDGPLIVRFAAENCLTLVVKPMTGAAAVLDLSTGKSDLMIGGILKSPARAKQFGQTNGQLTYETMGISSKAGYNTIDQLKGKKVGIQSGSSYTDPLKAAIGADNVVEYQSDVNALQDLIAGRIDATALTSLQGVYLSAQHPGYPTKLVRDDPAYPDLTSVTGTDWPHAKTATDLKAAVDDFYKRIHADGSLLKDLKANHIQNLDFYVNGKR